MSERFEKAIQDWYDNSRTASLEYLDLSEKPKPKLSELEHNISVIFDRLSLFSKVSVKDFKTIQENQKYFQEKLDYLETLAKQSEKENKKHFLQLASELSESKPLTKKEVLELVKEISQQPKLAEEKALHLTEELDRKIKQVEHQVREVERLVHEVKTILTT